MMAYDERFWSSSINLVGVRIFIARLLFEAARPVFVLLPLSGTRLHANAIRLRVRQVSDGIRQRINAKKYPTMDRRTNRRIDQQIDRRGRRRNQNLASAPACFGQQ